jgi:hypothetical protein
MSEETFQIGDWVKWKGTEYIGEVMTVLSNGKIRVRFDWFKFSFRSCELELVSEDE